MSATGNITVYIIIVEKQQKRDNMLFSQMMTSEFIIKREDEKFDIQKNPHIKSEPIQKFMPYIKSEIKKEESDWINSSNTALHSETKLEVFKLENTDHETITIETFGPKYEEKCEVIACAHTLRCSADSCTKTENDEKQEEKTLQTGDEKLQSQEYDVSSQPVKSIHKEEKSDFFNYADTLYADDIKLKNTKHCMNDDSITIEEHAIKYEEECVDVAVRCSENSCVRTNNNEKETEVKEEKGKEEEEEISDSDGLSLNGEEISLQKCDVFSELIPSRYEKARMSIIKKKHEVLKYKSHTKMVTRNSRLKNKTVHQCDVCKKYLSCKNALFSHLLLHKSVELFNCDLCGKSFNVKKYLTTHMESHDIQANTCHVCSKFFSRQDSLKRHLRTHVNQDYDTFVKKGIKEPLLQCNLCAKIFCTKSRLSDHLLTHESKRFKCDLCEKFYSKKSNLSVHIASHIELYKCNICNKTFSFRRSYIAHEKSHNLHVKSHNCCELICCYFCGKRYSRKESLRKHILSHHLSEREFICNICGKQFALKYSLKVHLSTHGLTDMSENTEQK